MDPSDLYLLVIGLIVIGNWVTSIAAFDLTRQVKADIAELERKNHIMLTAIGEDLEDD